MTDATGTWSDERVALLRKLWEEGRSASQIAAEIGGVTRNAVIGKVHRLGLSGRVKSGAPSAAKSRTRAAAPRAREAAPATAHRARPAAEPATRKPGPIAPAPLTQRFETVSAGRLIENAPPSEPALGEGERVTIMDLREGMCRWPIGDPTSPEFRFCGAQAQIGVPYCLHHAQIAYQPSADRRRDRKAASG
ncbi:MAG: GcrA cell cycle regulator [Salinarimonadaceae bacterium]|nr:MAG: GcrA cell cycle regulator [Salinarimonadaceae bacterium]